jgi:hypothetical protein
LEIEVELRDGYRESFGVSACKEGGCGDHSCIQQDLVQLMRADCKPVSAPRSQRRKLAHHLERPCEDYRFRLR